MTKVARKAQTGSRIPEFTSVQAEAEWWDTHSLARFQDQFKVVTARFGKRLSKGITVRLDVTTLARLRSIAQAKGIGPTTLARMWIMEHIQEAARQSPLAK